MRAVDRVAIWIEREIASAAATGDPYAVAYRRGAFDLTPAAVDSAVRSRFPLEAGDARRVSFLVWADLDARARSGSTAAAAEDLLRSVQAQAPCSREEALAGLRRLVEEGAVVGLRAGAVALVQLAPHAESEASVAAWVEHALSRGI